MTNFFIHARESGRLTESKKTAEQLLTEYAGHENVPIEYEFSTNNCRINSDRKTVDVDAQTVVLGRCTATRTYAWPYDDLADAVLTCLQIEDAIAGGVEISQITVR